MASYYEKSKQWLVFSFFLDQINFFPTLKRKINSKVTFQIIMKLFSLIYQLEQKQIEKRTILPLIQVGDTVQIDVLIREVIKKDTKAGSKQTDKTETKERIQPYEGIVISQKNRKIQKTIIVRKLFQGIGVERVFLIHSPCIKNIRIKKHANVRKSKLYFLRKAIGKKAKL